MNLDRLPVANCVLHSFAERSHITEKNSRLSVSWWDGTTEVTKQWQCRTGTDFYPVWHKKWPHGGTASMALSQLIRWIRELPVLPISTWYYWSTKKIALLEAEIVDYLEENGYPKEVYCIMCGEKIQNFDWYNLRGKSGPGCYMNTGCQNGNSK